jgi:hypothetical protein
LTFPAVQKFSKIAPSGTRASCPEPATKKGDNTMSRKTAQKMTEATELNFPAALRAANDANCQDKFLLFSAAYYSLVFGANRWAQVMIGETEAVAGDERLAAKFAAAAKSYQQKEGYDVICWMLSASMFEQAGRDWLTRLLKEMQVDLSWLV